jgi:hypothetical protein
MTKVKCLLAAAIAVTALASVSGWSWSQFSAPGAARDFEDCAEQAKAASGAQRAGLLTDCGARFAARRKPGGGYSYYDFMQDRSFDIAGPNPTADERKQIDREYMKYLDSVRRDVPSVELARPQNNFAVADLDGVATEIARPSGGPMVLTPKKLSPGKPVANRRNAAPPCPDGSLACSWTKLTAAVRNAFAFASKPETEGKPND